MKKKTKWKRKCPTCGEEITYSTKCAKIRAEKRNTNCVLCVRGSEKTREKMSESHKGIKFTDERKKNMSESKKGIKCSEEKKKKISKTLKGRKITWSNKIGESLKGGKRSEEARKKMSESHKGIKFTDEHKKNIRLSRLKYITSLCGQISPNYNKIGCEIIRWFNMYYGFNFQHAENGGEICIGGYWPDGIDEKQKTIIEIDEPHHFNSDGTYKEKDVRRQNYLEKLGYKIIRVRI
jgi:NOL1/NOP2/fmu family ribosome biogenesis protein